jgi:hypothetical protein
MPNSVPALSNLYRSPDPVPASTVIRTLRYYMSKGSGLGFEHVVDLTERSRLTSDDFLSLSKTIGETIKCKKFHPGVDRNHYHKLKTYFCMRGITMAVSTQET